MTDCCDNILDLGCIGFCDTIQTGIIAPATATYVISIVGIGAIATVSITSGAEIAFANPFNEDAVTVFQVLYNGTVLESGIYDCFSIKVNPSIQSSVESGACNTTYEVNVNGILRASGTLDCSIDNAINIYP